LADLFTLLFAANPFSAVRASLRRWSSDEFEDGLMSISGCDGQSLIAGIAAILCRSSRLVATAKDRLNTLLVLNGRGILG